MAQGVPEILYYRFDNSGTILLNEALNPPTGTDTATILGTLSQGSSGLDGGALIGTGASSSTNYVSTGWDTDLGTGSWTIMFWVDDVANESSTRYQFGDNTAGSFRCFTNGSAGQGDFILRGPIIEVVCTGCAPIGASSMTAFVYDSASGDIKAYHDGVLNNTVSQGILNISGTDFKVGGYFSFNGIGANQLMDEFRVYNRALDSSEISRVWNRSLPLPTAPNDAAVTAINEPVNFCSDTLDIKVTLKNKGIAQLTSATINWEFDGVLQTPVAWTGLLDTLGGVGSQDTIITIGTQFFAPNTPYDIKAWSTLPNGQADTVNVNDTTMTTVKSSLAGTFQIGGAGADYPNFAAAVAELNAQGVCGPVVFNVYDTTYNEQIELQEITGASSTNTITFQPLSGRPEVIFNNTSSSTNYLLHLSGAKWITFKGLMFHNSGTSNGRVVDMNGGSEHNTIEDCWIVGDTTPSSTSDNMSVIYSGDDQDNWNTFRNNLIRGGSYGAYWFGTSSSSLEEGNVFDGNRFVENYYRGTYNSNQDNLTFVNNHLEGNTNYTGSYYRFYFSSCDNALVVANNTATGNMRGYGIYMSACEGNAGTHGRIYNNMIHVGDSTSTSTSYGLYMSSCGFQDVYNNSFSVNSNGTGSRAAYFTGGGQNTFTNNIILNSGPGYGLYLNSVFSLSSSDHNNFYVPNGNAGYFNVDRATLADYQNVTGLESNSIWADPMFVSEDDLHVCQDSLDGAGAPGWAVMDIDGTVRSTTAPDIGADEFTPVSTFSLGPDMDLCTGDSVMLQTYANPSDTVLWSTGANTPSIWVSSPGTYSVNVSGACGMAGDTVNITPFNLVASYTFTTSFLTSIFEFTGTASAGTSFNWDFGDGASSTSDSPIHVYAVGGVYLVTLTTTDDCGTSTFSDSVNVSETDLLEGLVNGTVKMYPNPATDFFSVDLDLTTEGKYQYQITVRDIRGADMMTTGLQIGVGQTTRQFRLDQFASGLYLVEVRVDDQIVTKQLIVR